MVFEFLDIHLNIKKLIVLFNTDDSLSMLNTNIYLLFYSGGVKYADLDEDTGECHLLYTHTCL